MSLKAQGARFSLNITAPMINHLLSFFSDTFFLSHTQHLVYGPASYTPNLLPSFFRLHFSPLISFHRKAAGFPSLQHFMLVARPSRTLSCVFLISSFFCLQLSLARLQIPGTRALIGSVLIQSIMCRGRPRISISQYLIISL